MNKKFFIIILFVVPSLINAMEDELGSSITSSESESSRSDDKNDIEEGYSSSGGSSRKSKLIKKIDMMSELSSEFLPVIKIDPLIELYFGKEHNCDPHFKEMLVQNVQDLRGKNRRKYEEILDIIKKYRENEPEFSSEFFSPNNQDKNLLDDLINPVYDSLETDQNKQLKNSRKYRNVVCGLNGVTLVIGGLTVITTLLPILLT